ncbi:MAG: 1-deoxy-D-xylulose-5-phosphate synthase [Deltaproteobacteria bacterium]|nr:1-deoxy-D-xylulose-5-phosphate synthase [Deltaproteobacteria bacterium]
MELLQRIDSPSDLKRLQIDQLPLLSEELRQFILEKISRIGGHLGAALGAVELTVALHYVFDSPIDRIVWDVGHQAHGHKILTGRREFFHTLKQEGGLSGFLRRSESVHDIFGAGHASTSISAALGIREALRLKGGRGKVVAVIGDGGLTGGMAFEALNSAGARKGDIIIVVNDNGMSIGPNVGGLSEWFSRKLVGAPMTRWRRRVRTFLEAFDGMGRDAIRVVEHVMDASKAIITPGVLFEGLGFEYVGPVDGHDAPDLVAALRDASQLGRPVVVHACTTKGKGAPGVDDDDERKHAVVPFDLRSGEALKTESDPIPTYTSVFGHTLCEMAAEDPRVVAITAAMAQGTGLQEFSQRFPSRFYDVGIAEQHAVTFAAGLAVEGFRPVTAIYSTFLQRAFDQILHDVALQELPAIFCLDRSGFVGADGPTHHGVFDLSYLRMIPNMGVMAPKDEAELRDMLLTALRSRRPIAIRFPRSRGRGVSLESPPLELPWGQAELLRDEGDDLLIVAVGPHSYTALQAADTLRERGVGCSVINARFVKPLDEALLTERLARAKAVVSIEENALAGGFGSALLELCERQGLQPRLRRLGIPDRFIEHGSISSQQERCGLTPEGILNAFESLRHKRQVQVPA